MGAFWVLFEVVLSILARMSIHPILIELKYDKAVDTAIEQIKRRQYPNKVAQYTDDLLLVGVTYERDTKMHRCCIERAAVVKA